MNKLTPCILSLLLLLVSCKKEEDKDPLSQLPLETETGANTFGCLINGEIFKPGGAQLSGGSLNCNYQKVDGEYYFRLVGRNYNDGNNRRSIGVFLYGIRIKENTKYTLSRGYENSNGHGSFTKLSYNTYNTDSIYLGELWIKHFDTVGQVVSGTFWFDVVSETGEVVQVREGRFDVRYTR